MVVPLAGSRDAGPGRKWSVDTVADVAVGAAVEWLSSAGPEEKLLTVVLCCAQPPAAKSLLRAIKEVRPVAVGSRGVGGVVAVEAKCGWVVIGFASPRRPAGLGGGCG